MAKQLKSPVSISGNSNLDASQRRPLTNEANEMIADIRTLMENLIIAYGSHHFTAAQRKRMLSMGARAYGFADLVFDVSETNLEYAPGTFNRTLYANRINTIEDLRNILIAINQMLDVVTDALIFNSDEAYRMALIYYNTVRDLTRHGDEGAKRVFETLSPYFHRPRRQPKAPTEKQLLHDASALLHGTKDGKIVIENQRPHLAGGAHVVVDETHRPHGEWKATESGEISE